jgi:ATP/maltotriose-dependent transcriptional regulator MalT
VNGLDLLTDTAELLATKLALPRPQSGFVARGQLFARLDKGLERKLTLIAAPLGFGKTTLVSEWAATRTEPLAWVALDAGDNDPTRFWRYVITACRTFDAALGKTSLAALRASQQPSFDAVLTPFVNELAQLPGRYILVLDDYHVITSRGVHETVTFLLDHFPASLHLVVVTRSEPPLPLARLRARNELNELDTTDLRFSLDEVRTFFQKTLHLPLSPEAVARLEARTEGWAAGLRLMALALEGQPEQLTAEKLLATFSGQDRHILDYLVGEVLAAQPEAVQEFLLRTSFLNRLTGSLCAALTGRTDSGLLLEQLARANLFLSSLGGAGEPRWYRYHTLFAEAMHHQARQRFGETELRELYDKAALWYEAHGFLAEAVEAFIAARAFDRAITLIEQILEERGVNELYTLRRWIEQLPKEILDRHPALCFNYAMALLFTSDRYAPATAAQVEVPLRAAEQVWRDERNDPQLGQVLALRGMVALWQGDFDRSSACARESLELLAEDDVMWRGVSLLNVAFDEMSAGRINAAQPLVIEARALLEATQNIHGALAAMQSLAESCYWQGDFDQAAQYYEQILAEAIGGDEMLDDQANAFAGLGNIAYARNELDAAEQYASRALEAARRRGDEFSLIRSTVILARVQQARGELAQAAGTLQALMARTRHPFLHRQVQAWQARFALARDDLAAVEQWYATVATQGESVSRGQQEQEALLAARMQVVEGKTETALALLEPWRVDAHANGRMLSELETLALKALAYSAQSDKDRASKTLVRALTLAQPRDCLRVFLDEGETMRLMIAEFKLQVEKQAPRLRAYIYKLLSAFPADVSRSASKSEMPFEPLSPQEQRVLRLLAAGLSNPEIARELVVSTNTIKTQLQSIYRKLNVNNREQAADVARQLSLL